MKSQNEHWLKKSYQKVTLVQQNNVWVKTMK